MTGLILINRKYMSNADGCEKKGQITMLEKEVTTGHTVHGTTRL